MARGSASWREARLFASIERSDYASVVHRPPVRTRGALTAVDTLREAWRRPAVVGSTCLGNPRVGDGAGRRHQQLTWS